VAMNSALRPPSKLVHFYKLINNFYVARIAHTEDEVQSSR
jgi:hypothetical protein